MYAQCVHSKLTTRGNTALQKQTAEGSSQRRCPDVQLDKLPQLASHKLDTAMAQNAGACFYYLYLN